MSVLFKKSGVIAFLTSNTLTLVCLLWLFVLTFWGTLYQISHGLYITKKVIFNSWFFLAGGYIPLPGARLFLWVALLNLLCVLIFRTSYKWSKSGHILTHCGLLLLIVGSGYTLHFSEESSLTLREGQGLNTASDYYLWEVAAWVQAMEGGKLVKNVSARSLSGLQQGDVLTFKGIGVQAQVDDYYPNCQAFVGGPGAQLYANASGIGQLTGQPSSGDPTKNIPGLTLKVSASQSPGTEQPVLVYGLETLPVAVRLGSQTVHFMLRRKQHVLPLVVKLIDFKKDEYPGTSMAKSFESRVMINTSGLEREVVISMNKPFRHNDFTFYQSSYSQSEAGESSTLSVVKNPGRMLPYIASLIISLGMCVHFFLMLSKYANRLRRVHA